MSEKKLALDEPNFATAKNAILKNDRRTKNHSYLKKIKGRRKLDLEIRTFMQGNYPW